MCVIVHHKRIKLLLIAAILEWNFEARKNNGIHTKYVEKYVEKGKKNT